VAILTASITDRRSFENLSQWTKILSSPTGELPPVVLAVNEIDPRESAKVTNDEVETEYGGQFAGLFFVSALTAEGIENLFMFAAQVGYRFAIANRAGSETALDGKDTGGFQCCLLRG
jgi:50S ribosomal subunit-associated GTPase HflX